MSVAPLKSEQFASLLKKMNIREGTTIICQNEIEGYEYVVGEEFIVKGMSNDIGGITIQSVNDDKIKYWLMEAFSGFALKSADENFLSSLYKEGGE